MSREGRSLWIVLFPQRCLFCGAVTAGGEPICADCVKKRETEPCRRRFSLPGAGADGLLILAPFPYQSGFRKTLHRFKFRKKTSLAEPIGAYMAAALTGEGAAADGVCFVPMTRKKERDRGYNQSELLAKAVAEKLGLPCLPLLEKLRETDTQHKLNKAQRRKNVKGAYRAKEKAAGKTLLLVDDIVTTGATLCECAGELYTAGADRVICLCAADAMGGAGE